MNKKIYNEDLTLNLILNGDKLQKGSKQTLSELYKLDQETRKLQLRIAGLELEKRRLNKTDADYANRLNTINNTIRVLNDQIKSNYMAMMEMRKQIGLAGMTINQLNSHLKVLKAALYNATDPTIIKRLRKEIEQTNSRITTMTTGAGRMAQAWARLAREANKYSAAIGWVSIVVYAISTAIGNLVERLGLLDRKLSGVMKTTGLTREEARRLKREFDQTATPTKTDDLLDMARIAGKLGIEGFENIKKFTGAVDVLYTALGQDLNLSVEETAEKVGKLVNAFRITDHLQLPLDEALLRTGSLLNQLDKSSVASSGTILEYLTRLSSLGTTANYQIEDLAGLAAALETVNIPAERGSTALRNIISNLGKYSEKFSRILGVSMGEFKQMVETDINGTFLKLIQKTSEGDKSIIDIVQSMGDFEISGVRVAEVYGALAQNIDVVRKQQDIARRSFASSSSVMSEYNIQISDYLAGIDVQKKRIQALADTYNMKMAPASYRLYKGWVDMLYALSDLFGWISQHQRQILAIVPLYAAWKATAIVTWIKDAAFAVRFYTVTTLQSIKATIANNTVMIAWQRHGIKGAIVALKQLYATMGAGPWGIAIAAVGVLSGAFMLLMGKTDKLKESMADMVVDMGKAKRDLNGVFEELKKSNEGTEKRAQLIRTINEQYGQYLPKMLTEADNLNILTEAQRKANQALQDSIALKWKSSTFDEITAENAKERSKAAERALAGLEKTRGAQAFGAASKSLDLLSSDYLSGKVVMNEWNRPMDIQEQLSVFINQWGLNNEASRKALSKYGELLIEQRKEKERMDDFMSGYLTTPAGNEAPESSGGPLSEPNKPRMSEDEFKGAMKDLEIENTINKTSLNNKLLNEEEYKKQELNLEDEFIRKKLALHERYGQTADTKGDVEALRLQLSENVKARREMGNKELKEQDKVEKKLFDMDKLRIDAMAEGREKELAEEMKRSADLIKEYEQSGMDQGKINEATELERQNHLNRLYDINLKYIDKELENDTISYAERMATLEIQYREGEIKEEDYLARKKALNEKYQGDLVKWNKKNNDIDTEAMEAEIAAAITKGQLLQATEEDIQQKITAIRKKYQDKRERNAETSAQRELRILKEQFSQEQLDAFAQGEFVIGLAQQIGQGVGAAMGIMFDDTQKTNEAILKALIETVLDAAHAAILAWQGVILAREIATKGAAGIPSAAIYIGLIEMAYGTAKAVLANWDTSKDTGKKEKKTIHVQAAKGIYPVVGADDGRSYNARFIPQAGTGIYGEPTLIAERPEMVIDYPTLRNMQMNAPGMIDAIMAMRVPQYAMGRYPEGGSSKYGVGSSKIDGAQESELRLQHAEIIRLNKLLEKLDSWYPSIAIETYERKRERWKKVTSGGLK